jgi:hypothetical protein
MVGRGVGFPVALAAVCSDAPPQALAALMCYAHAPQAAERVKGRALPLVLTEWQPAKRASKRPDLCRGAGTKAGNVRP